MAVKIIFAILAAIFCLGVAARRTAIEDSNAAVRAMNKAFAPISLSHGISLFLNTSTKETLAESFSGEKYEERFNTKETGGVLKIYLYNQGVDHSGDKRHELKVHASFKILKMMIGSVNSSIMLTSVISVSNLERKFTSGSVFKGTVKGKGIFSNLNRGAVMKDERNCLENNTGSQQRRHQ